MGMHEQRLPVVRRRGKVVSEPLLAANDFSADNLLASDYQAAGKVIVEYQVRLLAANSAGEQIGLETHLVLEGPEFSRQSESISHSGGVLEAPPSRNDLGNPAENTFAQRLAELNLRLVQQLADLKETGRLMKDATEQVARAIPELRQGLGEIRTKLKPLKLGDESESRSD